MDQKKVHKIRQEFIAKIVYDKAFEVLDVPKLELLNRKQYRQLISKINHSQEINEYLNSVVADKFVELV